MTLLDIQVDNNRNSDQRKEDLDALRKKMGKFAVEQDQMTINGRDVLKYIETVVPKEGEKFPQSVLDQGIALAIIDKNLEYYANKFDIGTEVSNLRMHYIANALTIKNAVKQKKIKTKIVNERLVADENATMIPLATRYQWLKETVGTQTVQFKINWTYTDGGLKDDLQMLAHVDKFSYPEVYFYFTKMPDTVGEFIDALTKQIMPSHLLARKKAAWNKVASLYTPSYIRSVQKTPNLTEMQRVYDAIKVRVLDSMVKSGVKDPKFEFNDPKVREMLQKQIEKNQTAFIYREAVYNLLKSTMALIEFNTTVDKNFGGINTDPEDLTNALFIETLIDGMRPGHTTNLGNPSKPHKTTIGNATDFYKILDLNGDVLGVLFN